MFQLICCNCHCMSMLIQYFVWFFSYILVAMFMRNRVQISTQKHTFSICLGQSASIMRTLLSWRVMITFQAIFKAISCGHLCATTSIFRLNRRSFAWAWFVPFQRNFDFQFNVLHVTSLGSHHFSWLVSARFPC